MKIKLTVLYYGHRVTYETADVSMADAFTAMYEGIGFVVESEIVNV